MDEKEITLEAWKQANAMQIHFNEMSMKLRAFALTLVAALVTAESLSKNPKNAGLAAGVALIVWIAFYLMDRFWYHSLLIGSVLYGRALERHADEKLEMRFPPNQNPLHIYSQSLLGLADYIGQANQEHWKWRVNRKIDTYYGLVAVALFVLLLFRTP
jgi:hypothetical protein